MARTVALIGVPLSLGPVLGPVIGGVVSSALGWRWLLAINIPVGVVGLLLAAFWLRPDGSARSFVRFDGWGFALLASALVGLLWALSNVSAGETAAAFDVWIPGVAGAVLLVGFVSWARVRPHAVVDVALLRVRSVRTATAVMTLLGANLYAGTFLLPLLLLAGPQVSVADAVWLLAVQGGGALIARSVAGRLVERLGSRGVASGGFIVVTLATVPSALDLATAPEAVIALILLVRGLGMGVVLVPVMATAYRDIDTTRMPHASAYSRMAQQLGGAFATAATAVVLAEASAAWGETAGLRLASGGLALICAAAGLASLVLPSRASLPPERGE